MRLGVAAVLVATLIAGAAHAAPAPRRIMSMNLCADLLLLQLAPKSRIASVSYLAPGPAEALLPGAMKGVRTNRGSAEELLAQKPDLVLVGPFSTLQTRRLAEKVGAPVAVVRFAQGFEDVRAATLELGEAVGEPGRARALVAAMDAKLAWLAAHPPKRPLSVAAFSGDGSAPGSHTLFGEVLARAGAVNLAAPPSTDAYGRFDLEELVRARPDALVRGTSSVRAPTLKDDVAGHRLIRRLYAGRTFAYPEVLTSCGLPQSADAALALHAAFQRLEAAP